MELYDETGELVEGVLTQDEYQEKLEAEVKERIEELKGQGGLSDEEKEELEKLRAKDHNFAELRKKADNKDNEAKTWKEQSEELNKKIEELSGKITEKTKLEVESWKKEGFDLLGMEEEDQKKLEHILENDLSAIQPKTKEEYFEKLKKAHRLMPNEEPNPILMGNSVRGRTGNSEKSFADTDEGKELAEGLGFNYHKQQKDDK